MLVLYWQNPPVKKIRHSKSFQSKEWLENTFCLNTNYTWPVVLNVSKSQRGRWGSIENSPWFVVERRWPSNFQPSFIVASMWIFGHVRIIYRTPVCGDILQWWWQSSQMENNAYESYESEYVWICMIMYVAYIESQGIKHFAWPIKSLSHETFQSSQGSCCLHEFRPSLLGKTRHSEQIMLQTSAKRCQNTQAYVPIPKIPKLHTGIMSNLHVILTIENTST